LRVRSFPRRIELPEGRFHRVSSILWNNRASRTGDHDNTTIRAALEEFRTEDTALPSSNGRPYATGRTKGDGAVSRIRALIDGVAAHLVPATRSPKRISSMPSNKPTPAGGCPSGPTIRHIAAAWKR